MDGHSNEPARHESRITSAGNGSHEGSEGIIEGGGLLPFLAITGVLLASANSDILGFRKTKRTLAFWTSNSPYLLHLL